MQFDGRMPYAPTATQIFPPVGAQGLRPNCNAKEQGEKLMQDYPAAHSMDTEWFAVDTSGNLALFDSGEGGAVPESNLRVLQTAGIDSLDSFLVEMAKSNKNRLLKLNIPEDIINSVFLDEQDDKDLLFVFDEQILRSQEDAKIYIKKSITLPFNKPINGWIDGWLLLLASDDVIPQLEIEKNEDNYAVGFSGESIIVFVRKCNFDILQNLFEKGQIIAGKALRDYRNGIAKLFGFFVYFQSSGATLPYTCIGKPIIPLRLEDLPENLQDLISWNWFDRLQFNQSETIQPIEHMPCDTWGKNKWWVDTQGQEHYGHPDRYPG